MSEEKERPWWVCPYCGGKSSKMTPLISDIWDYKGYCHLCKKVWFCERGRG